MADKSQQTPADFYYVSIKELGLSEKAVKALKRYGVASIGDCLDHFARIRIGGNPGRIALDFIEAMHGEVKPKLIEYGFLPLDNAD